MKHFVFVESNTTGTGGIAVQRLLAGDHRVTFLTRTPKKYPFLERGGLNLRIREVDTNDLPLLLAVLGEAQREEGIDAVLTLSEFYVPAVAELAAALGLPGLNPEAARVCRHKPSTRRVLANAGMRTPEFHLLDSKTQAQRLAPLMSYPCVVKPPSDSSSCGVRMVRTLAEFLAHFETLHAWRKNVRGQALDGTVLVETLLDGPEYSVETFTTAAGVTHVIGVTDKHLSAAPHFVELGHDFPSRADTTITELLASTVLQALNAVGFDFGPAHTEIRLTQEGPAVVEINPRLAGGMIPELVKHATGIDILEAWISLLLGNGADLTPARNDHASIRFLTAANSGRLSAITGVEKASRIPCIREVAVTGKRGTMVREAEDAYDRLGFVIASSPNLSFLDEALADAVRRIHIEIESVDRELAHSCAR
ncbi:MAG TPA: ATP-grasp domain-containing protein [Candidatus Polarisedimenticolia bacterium]|nr:ATP-grasp domain-containing protein [Candidatus Polarisedimenticolia bacterium]